MTSFWLSRMAETAGVSRSSISRQAIEGSAEQLRQLRERRWDKTDLLVIYIDGQRFGDHHVISGVGIVSKRCLAAISPSSAAAITRCGMSWMNCRTISMLRSST
jgi:putative transposase